MNRTRTPQMGQGPIPPEQPFHRLHRPEGPPDDMTDDVVTRLPWPRFLTRPGVSELAGAPRWTISGRTASDPGSTAKVPLDIVDLLRHYDSRTGSLSDRAALHGAGSHDQRCLVDLAQLTTRIPGAANAAFYLDADLDRLVVVDIEPSCPPQVRRSLAQLPGILYAEVSMSGRGLHLLMDRPRALDTCPAAIGRSVLRHEQGWFEILVEHWVTFTARPVDLPAPCRDRSLDQVVTDLADSLGSRSQGSAATIATTGTGLPDIPGAGSLVDSAVIAVADRMRHPRDFHNDMSRWEFSVLRLLWTRLDRACSFTEEVSGTRVSPEDLTRLLYCAAVRVLPHRAKHDQLRNGRPYLLERAAAMVASHTTTQP